MKGGMTNAVEMLRRLERCYDAPMRQWISDNCPICQGQRKFGGHKPDCALAAILRRGDENDESDT